MKPGTTLLPFFVSGTHWPVPSNCPSLGSCPVPRISFAGESPENFATYRSPSESSVMFFAREAEILFFDTNLYR